MTNILVMRNIVKAGTALLMSAVMIGAAGCGAAGAKQTEVSYAPMKKLTNICAYEGEVYCGKRGFYGKPIVPESNIFTMQNETVYYVEKVQEAFESLTDEKVPLWSANLDGSDAKKVAEDVFLAGAGHERLIGNKLFYGRGYDENYRMMYSCVDLDSLERSDIASERIDDILGYDGIYLYYNGTDEDGGSILGRIPAEGGGKDNTLLSYAAEGEAGHIDNVSFYEGKLYCLTLKEQPEGYDYRTYQYSMQIRDADTGKIEKELPQVVTGSANYSFLVEGELLYLAGSGRIDAIPLDGKQKGFTVTQMKEGEYWGILHFLPGDGYLYYEAIADTDEQTGNNDYFYRVPVTGGKPQQLAAWFTV